MSNKHNTVSPTNTQHTFKVHTRTLAKHNANHHHRTMTPFWSLQIQLHLVTHRSTSNHDAKSLLRSLLNQSCLSKCSLKNCHTRHKYVPLTETEPPEGQSDLKTWSCSIRPHRYAGPAAGPTEGEFETTPDLLKNFRYHLVCLESPKFPISLPRHQSIKAHRNHAPHFSFEWQVNRIVRIPQAPNLDELAPSVAAIYTNANTHLRVQISSPDLMFGTVHLQTFKSLLGMAANYERFFDSIRTAGQIRRGLFDAQGWGRCVQQARSWREVSKLSQSTPLRFSTRLISSVMKQGVEFIFPGTLDADEVFYAVDLARSLFAYAEKVPYPELAVGMWDAFTPNFAYTLPDFLQQIGISRTSLALVLAKLGADQTWPSYAESMYVKQMRELSSGHVLFELLRFVALEKRMQSDQVSIDMVINEKMRNGEYGWYQRGASIPWHSRLPVFDADLAGGQLTQSVMETPTTSRVASRHDSVVYDEQCSLQLVAPDKSERSCITDADFQAELQDAYASRKVSAHTPSSSWTSSYHDALEHQQETRSGELELKEDLSIDETGSIDWHLLPSPGCRTHSFRFRRWSISLPLNLGGQQ